MATFPYRCWFPFIDDTQIVLSDTIETSAVILTLWQCYASRVLEHLRRTNENLNCRLLLYKKRQKMSRQNVGRRKNGSFLQNMCLAAVSIQYLYTLYIAKTKRQPVNADYKSLFDAIVFTVHDCGFVARCVLEAGDASQVRIDKIYNIIADCRYGIHDISRTELDETSCLPRFNMPLELGVFLGAKKFGIEEQQRKKCLVMDREKYRYQKFISDIAGQNVQSHNSSPEEVVKVVRDWLLTAVVR